MNIVGRHWRKIMHALDQTENLDYDTLLQHSQALRDSYQNFLSMKATQDLNSKDLDAFAIINRFVR